MLQRALDALRDAGLEPAVVAPDAGPYRSLCSSFVTSERPGRGPVEGLLAALKATQEPWALVLSVDMPRVGVEVLRPLIDVALATEGSRADRGPGAASAHAMTEHPGDTTVIQVACYGDEQGLRHPFPGIYHFSILPVLEGAAPGASMQEMLDRIALRLLRAADLPEGFDLAARLRNANRPSDLFDPPGREA